MTPMPERIAMCSNPDGLHEHIPVTSAEDLGACFAAGCDCTLVEYVRADVALRDEPAPNVPPELAHLYEGETDPLYRWPHPPRELSH